VIERPDPIEAWRDVSQAAARSTGYRTDRPARRWSGMASIGAMTMALAIIVVGLVLRPAASGIGTTGSVTATAEDGTFRLELTTPHAIYGPGGAITPVGRVTYLGPDGTITVQHSHSQLVFQVDEVGGKRQMEGGSRDSCESTSLVQGVPLDVPFAKSGSPDDPAKGFDLAWYTDPTLTLPVGTWRITVNMEFRVGGCGGTGHELRVSNVIRVVAPTGDGPVVVVPSRIPSVAPTTSPATTPSTVPFSNEPVSGSVHDGVFRLDLKTPHGIYGPGDVIKPVATLFYVGPQSDVTFGHGAPTISFRIEEVGGNRVMDGGVDDVCLSTTLARGQPAPFTFIKGRHGRSRFRSGMVQRSGAPPAGRDLADPGLPRRVRRSMRARRRHPSADGRQRHLGR
jgi:hypothetical protein